MWDFLNRYRARSSHRVVGLMSGTSVDGIDAALVEIHGEGETLRAELQAYVERPFPPDVRAEVLAACEAGSTEQLCRLNFRLGELFAEAALAVIAQAGLTLEEVDLIGSHGQTVYHLPPTAGVSGASLQLGEPSVIAERTGLTTVAEFRYRDLAAGGHGAPLVPYVDFLLFRHPRRGRVVQNIGGIANFTYLPPGADWTQVLAGDTGPGNMVIDAATSLLTGGAYPCDVNGCRAAAGQVDEEWLTELLAHPFLALPPPKSTGREMFGRRFAEEAVAEGLRRRRTAPDILATLTAFTAASIVLHYDRFVRPCGPLDEVILCGGGRYNPTLRRMLQERLPGVALRTLEELGLSSRAKEAMSFAILAHQTILGRPNNVPRATGARHPVVLGKIVPGASGPRMAGADCSWSEVDRPFLDQNSEEA